MAGTGGSSGDRDDEEEPTGEGATPSGEAAGDSGEGESSGSSEGGSSGGGAAKSSDLKARLGIKNRRRPPAGASEQGSSQGAAGSGQTGAEATTSGEAEPSADEVEEARRRAEEASAEAGPSAEDFSVVGQDRTPPPGPMPGAEEGASGEGGGVGRLRFGPVIVTIVVVGLVAAFLGQILGRALSERQQLSAYRDLVADKLEYVENAKVATGEPVLERIEAMKKKLEETVATIDELERKGGDPLSIEDDLQKLVKALERYEKQNVYVKPGEYMRDLLVLYQDDVLLDGLDFVMKTRRLYERISAARSEAANLAEIGQAKGASKTRTFLVREGKRMYDEADEKIPIGEAAWIQDTGKPAEVEIVNERTGETRKQWQQMVVPDGEDEPVQVPTSQVVQLDLSPIYDKHNDAIRALMVERLTTLTRNLHQLAKGVKWEPLRKRFEEKAAGGGS